MPLVYLNDEEYLSLMNALLFALNQNDITSGPIRDLYDRCAIMYGLPWEDIRIVAEEEDEVY